MRSDEGTAEATEPWELTEKRQRKSHAEEEQLLQRALLASVGVRLPPPENDEGVDGEPPPVCPHHDDADDNAYEDEELGAMEAVIATSSSKQQEGEASVKTPDHEHDDDDDGFVVVRSKSSRPPSISRTSWQWERLTQRVQEASNTASRAAAQESDQWEII